MPHVLIIAEKPSAAREIAAALLGQSPTGGNQFRGKGPNGEDITIGAARGHIVELANPKAYNEIHGKDFGRWNVADLPILPKENWGFIEIVKQAAADVMRNLAGLVHAHTEAEIVNACDSGREGELIYRKATAACAFDRTKTKQSRMWFSSMTRQALIDAFNGRKPLSDYDGLAQAGYTRDQADWLVGMNKTVLATKTLPRGSGDWKVWSVGRVQTPTLAIIVDRDLTIGNFQPQPFWEAYGVFGELEARADLDALGKSEHSVKLLGAPMVAEERTKVRFWSKDCALAFAASAKDGPRYSVKDTGTIKTTNPPLPMDLQEAQKYCSKKWGMTAQETLALLQELYEAKLISYPRTDSRHFPEDMRAKVYADVTAALAAVKAAHPGLHISQLSPPPRATAAASKAFNNSKVSDHYGLCPTSDTAALRGLAEQKLFAYLAILQAVLMTLDEPEKTKVITRRWTQVAGSSPYFPSAFRASVEKQDQAGWTRWQKPNDGDANKLTLLPPPPANGEMLLTNVKLKEAKTTPPKPFADDTLLDAMKYAGANFNQEGMDPGKIEDMLEVMKDRGIGTPATRANIIETLEGRGYIERKRKTITATENGHLLIASLRERDAAAVSAAMTGEWELELKKMERGQAAKSREAFLQSVLDQFLEVKDGFISNSTRSTGGGGSMTASIPVEGVVCPKSGQPMLDRGSCFEAPGFPEIRLWKNALGKEWTAADYVSLLAGFIAKQPVEFFGLKTKEGREYSAPITINTAANKVVLYRPDPIPTEKKCPKSKKAIVDFGDYWIAPGWPKLRLWKANCGRPWALDEYVEVLAGNLKGEAPLSVGLVSKKSGANYSAKLRITSHDADKFTFEFPPRAA